MTCDNDSSADARTIASLKCSEWELCILPLVERKIVGACAFAPTCSGMFSEACRFGAVDGNDGSVSAGLDSGSVNDGACFFNPRSTTTRCEVDGDECFCSAVTEGNETSCETGSDNSAESSWNDGKVNSL